MAVKAASGFLQEAAEEAEKLFGPLITRIGADW